MIRRPPLSAAALVAVSMLATAGCGTIDDFTTGSRDDRAPPRPAPTPADPPATEAAICDLAKQAVKEVSGLTALRGETCTAAPSRPGEWEARVAFMSGSQQQTYRVSLQPTRQRQGWAAVDVTPQEAAG